MSGFFTYRPIISNRVDVTLITTSILCGILSVVIGYEESWFADFWMGGVLGLPIGLAIGVAWEWRRKGATTLRSKQIWVSAVASLVLSGFAVFHEIPRAVVARRSVQALRTLPIDSVVRIEFSEPFGNRIIATIDDENSLSDFAIAARDVRILHPGKGALNNRSEWWVLVVLQDGERFKLEWTIYDRSPNVIGRFIKTTPNSVSNQGNFLSVDLRTWYSRYVEPEFR